MERGGNAKVNAVFEARLPPGSNIKPTNHADGPTRERFIRDKYERRKYYDPSGLSNAPTEDFAPSESAAGGAAVGPPSDAAKQRLEQRRARINKASSTVSNEPTIATLPPKTRTRVAKAPASAPPPSVDLLDLMGGFDSAPTQDPPKAPTGSTESPAAGLDLFDFSSTAVPDNSTSNQDANNQWNELTQMPTSQAPRQQPKPALDLSSLYNGAHQQQQPMGFANFPSGGNMYAANPMPNQMMMNNGMPNANMQQMTSAMQNMSFSSMTPQQMAYQQQQMMMMQQQQQQMRMMMMSQQPQSGGMMPQQQQFSTMNGHNFGASFPPPTSPAPPSTHGMKAAAPAKPEKEDPFAQFGTNMFRSY